MKIRYLSLLLMLCILTKMQAQFEKDNKGNIIPFSKNEKYRRHIKTRKIKTFEIPAQNNDSLYWINNTEENLKKGIVACGFLIDTVFSFKKIATQFKLPNGSVWVLKIHSSSAEALGIHFKRQSIEKESMFAAYSNYSGTMGRKKLAVTSEDNTRILKQGLYLSCRGSTLYVEYYEGNSSIQSDIIVEAISYDYNDGFKKKSPPLNGHGTDKLNKSGAHGTAINNCQYDLVCPEVQGFYSEARGVCFIRVQFISGGNKFWYLGTGFFINKSGDGYATNEKPYLFTCGHLFAPEINGVPYDISTSHTDKEVYVNYYNSSCNDNINTITGDLIDNSNSFSIKKLGGSYLGPSAGNYIESEDYVILEAPGTFLEYSSNMIGFLGWTVNHNFQEWGYAALGHPNGDVMKVNIVDERAYARNDGTNALLYYDKGVNEHGCSGSPVFNSSRIVVGWVCRGVGDCANVGKTNDTNRTVIGRFENIHFSIFSYIDPSFENEAPFYNDINNNDPPGHCTNCVVDADKGEIDIDCGGPCKPCGFQNHVVVQSFQDLDGFETKSKNSIIVQPSSENSLHISSDTYEFTAGQEVSFYDGFKVTNGANMVAKTNVFLSVPEERGCQDGCVNPPNSFSPNGDGLNDFWGFDHAYITDYEVVIYDRNYKVYAHTSGSVGMNGFAPVWTGDNANSGVYYCEITYTDCKGATRLSRSYIHVFSSKSSEDTNTFPQNDSINSQVDNYKKIFKDFIVYPNPTKDKLTIDYPKLDVDYEFVLMDQNGKTIKKDCGSNKTELDLSFCSPGLYLLQIKVGKEFIVKKVIKE